MVSFRRCSHATRKLLCVVIVCPRQLANHLFNGNLLFLQRGHVTLQINHGLIRDDQVRQPIYIFTVLFHNIHYIFEPDPIYSYIVSFQNTKTTQQTLEVSSSFPRLSCDPTTSGAGTGSGRLTKLAGSPAGGALEVLSLERAWLGNAGYVYKLLSQSPCGLWLWETI